MAEKRKNQTPFMIYMPDILYNELKKICKERDMPMNRYVIKAILTRINMEAEQKIKI